MITNVKKAGVWVYAKMSLKTECVLIKNMTPAIFISGTKTGILLFIYDCLKTISISPTWCLLVQRYRLVIQNHLIAITLISSSSPEAAAPRASGTNVDEGKLTVITLAGYWDGIQIFSNDSYGPILAISAFNKWILGGSLPGDHMLMTEMLSVYTCYTFIHNICQSWSYLYYSCLFFFLQYDIFQRLIWNFAQHFR